MASLFPCPGMSFGKKFSFAPQNLTQHWCSTYVQGGGNGAKRADFHFFSPNLGFISCVASASWYNAAQLVQGRLCSGGGRRDVRPWDAMQPRRADAEQHFPSPT